MECNDKNCPKHGNISIRGRAFIGVITSIKAQKTATIEWETRRYVPKYERYEKKRTKLQVHNPECFNIIKGDRVRIAECRPLSKTKHFVIVEKLGREAFFAEKEGLKEEAKVRKAKKLQENTKNERMGMLKNESS